MTENTNKGGEEAEGKAEGAQSITAEITTGDTLGNGADTTFIDQTDASKGPKIEDVPLPGKTKEPISPIDQGLVDEIQGKIDFFMSMAQKCIWLHWGIGILGATTATLAASSQFIPEATATFATISAVCITIIGFVSPQKRATRFLTAYRMLDPALREYKYNRSQDPSVQKLLEAHLKTEAILNDGEFDGK